MLPLLTEATIEVTNVSMDQPHPFHTCNDYNLFNFNTQQNIVVNTDDI